MNDVVCEVIYRLDGYWCIFGDHPSAKTCIYAATALNTSKKVGSRSF